MLWPSRMENCLETATSHSQNPGPKTAFAPIFPYVPGAGCANAAGFHQATHGAGAHDFPLLGESMFASTCLGRWTPVFPKMPFNALSKPVNMVKGWPVRAV